MKITRRSDRPTGGHFLVSVPAARINEVEGALTFLEETRQAPASQVIVDLIVSTARRRGWKPATAPAQASSSEPGHRAGLRDGAE